MNKVENQCKECSGLGWVKGYHTILACVDCKLFADNREAFVFVTTTCEQWQRTVALIFATRLLAEAVSIPPMQTAKLEDGVKVTPESANLQLVDRKSYASGFVPPWPLNVQIPTEEEFKKKKPVCSVCGVPDGSAHSAKCHGV